MHSISLHDKEQVTQYFRKTHFVLAGPALLSLLLLYVPWSVLIKYGVRQNFAGFLFLYSLLVLGYFSRAYALWWRVRYIITSHRLIKMSHEGLFKKLVIETPLDRILNVSYKTTGFFSSIFSFGDVEVQVVGLIEPIVLKQVRYPAKLKDRLWKAHEDSLKGPHRFDAESIPEIQQQIGYTKKNQKVV